MWLQDNTFLRVINIIYDKKKIKLKFIFKII